MGHPGYICTSRLILQYAYWVVDQCAWERANRVDDDSDVSHTSLFDNTHTCMQINVYWTVL